MLQTGPQGSLIPNWDNPASGLLGRPFFCLDGLMPGSLGTQRYTDFIAMMTRARRDAGMTQQQVADALEAQQSYVAKFERGERRLDIIEFIDLAKALGVDPHAILDALAKTSGDET